MSWQKMTSIVVNQNMGKSPVKYQYRKFLNINSVLFYHILTDLSWSILHCTL